MPAIIYQKTPGGLFATGERTVSTFPSGLVRVDQSFVCPTSDAATHRAALAVGNDMPGDSAPAIDGLKIFPEPQEKKRDNGFTEFIVSAYGRTSDTLKDISINKTRHRFTNWGDYVVNCTTIGPSILRVDAVFFEITGKIVITNGSSLSYSDLNIPVQYSEFQYLNINNTTFNHIQSDLRIIDTTSYKYVDWNGDKRTNQYIIYGYYYGPLVENEATGGSDLCNRSEHDFRYDMPVIYVNKRTNFGNFLELEITARGRVSDSVDFASYPPVT
jgi:hypothetical protein